MCMHVLHQTLLVSAYAYHYVRALPEIFVFFVIFSIDPTAPSPPPSTVYCVQYSLYFTQYTLFCILYSVTVYCILCATLDNFFFDKNQRDRNRRSQMISITIVAQEFCALFPHIFRYSLISPIMISFSDIGQSDILYSPSDQIYPESDLALHETFLRLPGLALLTLFRNPSECIYFCSDAVYWWTDMDPGSEGFRRIFQLLILIQTI